MSNPKHRIYFTYEVTGHFDLDYLRPGQDPEAEFKTYTFEEVLMNTREGEDLHAKLLSTRAESRDSALEQLARVSGEFRVGDKVRTTRVIKDLDGEVVLVGVGIEGVVQVSWPDYESCLVSFPGYPGEEGWDNDYYNANFSYLEAAE